ncbi:MAG TPA: hypothetical protein PKL67_17815, partial [Anaerolineae bacterium]|nr:hypothetical protein [Anaerolineae bacterium]
MSDLRHSPQIDPDAALRLTAAIARQWLREQPDDIDLVADWLGLEPDQLRRPIRAARPARHKGKRRTPPMLLSEAIEALAVATLA